MAGASVAVDDQVLELNAILALHLPKTRLNVHHLHYLVEFSVQCHEEEQRHLKERNRMLQEQGTPLPLTKISSIPFSTNTVLPSIVFRNGLGSGSFGNVFEGYDPRSGDLRVAKRITIRSEQEVPDVELEIEALKRFDGTRQCILKLLDWRTELNGQQLRVSQYPLDVYLIHEKGIPFHHQNWETVLWDLKRQLCYQLLKGLAAIHEAGCMHRDITQTNILFFPYHEPPEARLCDFGKFCYDNKATDTRLAAWQFLPPELEKGEQHSYEQALDIWMLGFAMANAWWPDTARLQAREKKQYKYIQACLRDEKKDGDDLARLVSHTIAWDPEQRPSAVKALGHRSLKGMAYGTEPVKTSNAKRLHDYGA
ncbi:MAG: hypothetical protein Q9178_007345 [Gyalolechia marmorata]